MPRKDLPFIDVYFPPPNGEGMKRRWEDRAKKEGMSRAAFIREAVERYINQADSPHPPKEAFKLQQENRKLREELKLRSLALEKAETDLFRMRNGIFLEKHGWAELDRDLIELLKSGSLWKADQILESLGINPRDIEAIRIVSKQLQLLQAAGMVAETMQGWRWLI